MSDDTTIGYGLYSPGSKKFLTPQTVGGGRDMFDEETAKTLLEEYEEDGLIDEGEFELVRIEAVDDE
ncbi:hypothetical protein [Halosegnis longus]|uniref:hypothetical protein n=1 Tax=Halosegnis longus TaxID=2216012 RepID=UPI00129E26F1|nr:hypothetical protein [Halosegnis longus]